MILLNPLCIPLRYFFSFRSKMVYLSLGTISSSHGISSFHLSTAFVVMPCLANALSTVATTVSTARRRFRCRAFWNLDSLHGIFLSDQLTLAEPSLRCCRIQRFKHTREDLQIAGSWVWKHQTLCCWCGLNSGKVEVEVHITRQEPTTWAAWASTSHTLRNNSPRQRCLIILP